MLNTPIKKIRALKLSLPRLPGSPVRYPSMSDIPAPQGSMFENMVDRGYSQTFSNSVLQELNLRAQQISGHIELPPKPVQRKKRYLGAHKPLFQKMESIGSHYAAQRQLQRSSPAKEASASAKKKRRTLNGPEELFGDMDKENELPLRRKDPNERMPPTERLESRPTLAPPRLDSSPFKMEVSRIPRLDKSPEPGTFSQNDQIDHSPVRNGSPLAFNKISPSKGHMNLNSLLLEDSSTLASLDFCFAKPLPKQRQTSLQMAGVAPGTIQKKPSVNNLQKKPSIPSLQKKSLMASLHSNSSFKSLIPSLQPRPSIPDLQKKPSFSNLQKSKTPDLSKKASYSSLRSSNISLRPSETILRQKPSLSNLQKKPSSSNLKSNIPSSRNVTIPQPFSLYDKPTISSSQKSLTRDEATRSASRMSISSMNSEVSQRSLSKFQRFKSRFS